MQLLKKKEFTENEKNEISRIWNKEYPMTLNFTPLYKFDDYLNSLIDPVHFILINDTNQVLAWATKFYRDREKWFALILDEVIHRKGQGTEILNAIRENENCLNAWVIDNEKSMKLNGEMYVSPLNFYLKNGFELNSTIRLENEKMSAVKMSWNRR